MAISFKELLGMSQATSGDYRSGLGNQEDLEPGGHQQYVQTTKPNTTVMSQTKGVAPKARRVSVTQLVSEAEYLAGTPGIHPRVLAQKVWQARKALMGSSRWEWANYQVPGAAYDSYADLVGRLEAVESVLGVGEVSPKIMSQLYGAGGLGAYADGAYRGAQWGQMRDPISQLASCIRGTLCKPKAFCCDQGTYYEDPFLEEEELFWDEFPGDVSSAGAGPGGAPPTLVEIADPRTQPPRTQPPRTVPPRTQPPKTPPRTQPPPPPPPPRTQPPRRPVTGGGVTYGQKPAIAVGPPGGGWVPPTTRTRPLVGGAGVPVGRQRGAMVVGGGTAPSTAIALSGLGRRSAMDRLIYQLRQARRQVRR